MRALPSRPATPSGPRLRRAATALILTACAAACAAPAPVATGYRAPAAPDEPFRSVVLQASYGDVRDQLEPVGATCWLDAELAAANMLVDRSTGDVTFFRDEGKVLTADIVPIRTGVTEVRLIGAVMDEPGRHQRMKATLTRAVETGTVTC